MRIAGEKVTLGECSGKVFYAFTDGDNWFGGKKRRGSIESSEGDDEDLRGPAKYLLTGAGFVHRSVSLGESYGAHPSW